MNNKTESVESLNDEILKIHDLYSNTSPCWQMFCVKIMCKPEKFHICI